MGNFAANLKREVSHTTLTDLEPPPPLNVHLELPTAILVQSGWHTSPAAAINGTSAVTVIIRDA